MAITAYVGGLVTAPGLTNVTATLPTTPAAGDLIIVQVWWRVGSAATDTLSISGYTQYFAHTTTRTLQLWYKIATGGDANPVVVPSGGLAGYTLAAVSIVLSPSAGSEWAWGTDGPLYNIGNLPGEVSIGPIQPPSGAGSQGCAIYAGIRSDGNATNVPVLSGDGLTWTRSANHHQTTPQNISFVGSIGIWSGSVPSLTDKTFTYTTGGPTGSTAIGVLVNEIAGLTAAHGIAELVAQPAGLSHLGQSIEPQTGFAALVGQNAAANYNPRIDARHAIGALAGQKADLSAIRLFPALTAYGALIGRAADLQLVTDATTLEAQPAYGKLIGQQAPLIVVRSLEAQPAYGALVGFPTSLITPQALTALTGYARLVGFPADLTLSVAPVTTARPPFPGNDIAWKYDSSLGIFGDLDLDAFTGPVLTGDLRSDIIVSLGTDARAAESDEIPDGTTNRRGWWGDVSPANGLTSDEFGSLFWLLSREKQIASVLVRVRDYATKALQWLVDDGIADHLEIEAVYPRMGWIVLTVNVFRPSAPPSRFRFDLAWQAQAAWGTP